VQVMQYPDMTSFARLVADKEYKLIAPDFVAQGGDGYEMLKELR
jgi:2',3'-cyclic-nucleotide 2'-phosphodiesterase (5'-nucleotidase family)